MKTSSIQSSGGKARAESLTPSDRKAIAAKAAAARWGDVPMASHAGNIKIGDIEIPCAVLEDGTRVITRYGLYRALGRTGKAKGGTEFDDESQTPQFLASKSLNPFITNDLLDNSRPVRFRTEKSGKPNVGFRASILPSVCRVFLEARDANVLKTNQLHIAAQCDIVVRALAEVGINALVDEATGYQEVREKDALSKILEKYIAKELQPWTKRFPDEFYQRIAKLHGWPSVFAINRPGYVGTLTNKIVYDRLPPGVLEELKTKNPKNINGNRAFRHHQFLTEEMGNRHLERHLSAVITLMRVSSNWSKFMLMFEAAFPPVEGAQQVLDFMVDGSLEE